MGFSTSHDEIRKMTKTIAHRGPDAEGFWSDEHCSIGHRRLSIIDLSEAANQPMVSQCGRYVIVYNGEVFNFREIAVELGTVMKTASDTEVIVEAFAIWGDGFVSRLNGMFAIAIYDTSKKELHLYRDRIGIKPLYYYHDNHKFAFASELKALMAHPEIAAKSETDMDAVRHFLHLGYVPEPFSIYRQISKFPKGGHGVFEGNTFTISHYWMAERQIGKELMTDENEVTDMLHYLLKDSIRKRLISDVPLGAFLSGGIDSSTVTAVAQSLLGESIKTFTIIFKEEKFNEGNHARNIAGYLGTDHHEFFLEEADAMKMLPALNDIYDEPFADSSAIPTLLVSEMSRRHVTMTLSGDGGDELFFGYGAHQWAERLNNPFWKVMRKPAGMLLKAGNSRARRASWLFDDVPQKHLPLHIFSQEQYYFSMKEIADLHLNTTEITEHGLPSFSQIGRELTPAETQALYDLKMYLPDDLLTKVDRAGMYHSLEIRVPLLDYRIVEFALNLAPELKLRNKTTKYLLKKILYQYVPETFFDRPKRGFSIPLAKWMRGSMFQYMMDYLHSEKLQSLLGVHVDKIPAVRKWKSGNDLYYNRVWQLVVLGRWLDSGKAGR